MEPPDTVELEPREPRKSHPNSHNEKEIERGKNMSRVQDALDGSGMDEKSEDPSLPESVSKAPNRGRYAPESIV